MALPIRSDLASWGHRLHSELTAQAKHSGGVTVTVIAKTAGMSREDVRLVMGGAECPRWWYEAVEKAMAKNGIVVPHPADAPRNGPPKDLDAMSEEQRREIAGDPRYIPWLCHELFEGPDGKPIRLTWFHSEILEKCFRGGNLIVNLPTDHGKSLIACYLFPILSLMNDPNATHILVGANQMDAIDRLTVIKWELENNQKLAHYYPWVARPEAKGRWAATFIDVAGKTVNKADHSIMAKSPLSSDIKGRRGKLIMDDLEGNEDAESPAHRRKLYNWVKLQAIRNWEDEATGQRPLRLICGTPFIPDSLYFKLEYENWETVRYSVKDEDGRWLWPDKQAKVEEMRAMMSRQQFAIAYEMDPTGGDPSILSERQIKEMLGRGEDIPDDAQLFVCHDPASGGGIARKRDYAGITVVAVHWPEKDDYPMVKVLRAYDFSGDWIAQVQLCGKLSREFEGIPTIWEKTGPQAGLEGVYNRYEPMMPTVAHDTKANKFDSKMGVMVLKTLLHRSRFFFPTEGDQAGKDKLVEELATLGQEREHDHLCYSIWFAIWHVYQQRRLRSIQTRTQYANPFGSAIGRLTVPIGAPAQPTVMSERERLMADLMRRAG